MTTFTRSSGCDNLGYESCLVHVGAGYAIRWILDGMFPPTLLNLRLMPATARMNKHILYILLACLNGYQSAHIKYRSAMIYPGRI